VSGSSGKCCTGYKSSVTLVHNPVFPFIDHVMSEMERRFPDDLKNHMTGYYLIPKHQCTPEMRLSVSGENRSTGWKPPTCRKSLTKLYHIMLYRVHHAWAWFELITLVVIDTDCTGSCKSNYHAIMKLKSRCYWIIVCPLWRITALLMGFVGGNWKVET
jgi:hypothetical protein